MSDIAYIKKESEDVKGLTLPNSIEAEQSILSAIMLDNKIWDAVNERLCGSDFYHPAHQKIFTSIQQLSNEAKPFDPLTVSENLTKKNELQNCGGDNYLAELIENIPQIGNWKAYVDIVYEKSVLRRLVTAGRDIYSSAMNPGNKNWNNILEYAERKIFRISELNSDSKGPLSVKPLLKKTLNRIDELFNSKDLLTGITTGFADLDEKTSGLQSSDLVIVAARPSMGKTVFGMNLVEAAIDSAFDKPVVVFSLEMPAEQLLMRTLSSLGKINQTKVKTGRLEESDWPKLASAVKRLKDKKLFIDDTPGLSPQIMRSRLRRIASEHGDIGMVMVDYLQLMSIPDFKEGRTNEISEISRSLKSLAKEFNTPVVALSQLNRSLENRPNKRPMNSDLRESGAIEQDADLIIFIYRDEVYNPDTEHKGIGEIIIGKQRNGPIGTVRLSFMGQYACFADLMAQTDQFTTD